MQEINLRIKLFFVLGHQLQIMCGIDRHSFTLIFINQNSGIYNLRDVVWSVCPSVRGRSLSVSPQNKRSSSLFTPHVSDVTSVIVLTWSVCVCVCLSLTALMDERTDIRT